MNKKMAVVFALMIVVSACVSVLFAAGIKGIAEEQNNQCRQVCFQVAEDSLIRIECPVGLDGSLPELTTEGER